MINENKLVSVLIPTYNVQDYVEECIYSITNQTYKNLEIIIVDDASTDNTYKIVRKLASQDKRIKYFRNSKNLKQAKTLNFALSMAKGFYIARIDSDDFSAKDRIEKQVNFIEKNKKFDLVGLSNTIINAAGEKIGFVKYYSSQRLIKKTLKYHNPVAHSWLATKTLYDELGGYRNIVGAEDYDFILRATSASKKYTNLENYYGHFYRLGRPGNTINIQGALHLRLHDYVYKLYKERENNHGYDNFSEKDILLLSSSNKINKFLYSYANFFLYKALEYKNNKNYFNFIVFLFLSAISIDRIKYLYRRIIYKFYIFIYSL